MRTFSVVLCFIIILVELTRATLNPNGEHVCVFDEKYVTTVQIREMIPVKVNKVKWCWKMPPRCTYEETEMRPQIIEKEVPRSRIVPKCCRGYASDLSETKCIPVCSHPCIHGVCSAPDRCACESGFYGEQCQKQCPKGKWGRNCVEDCHCLNGAICGSVNGECTCGAGWQGSRCEETCAEGYFGFLCENRCQCGGELCNHVTGLCLYTTTTTTTELPTTITTMETTAEYLPETVTEIFTTENSPNLDLSLSTTAWYHENLYTSEDTTSVGPSGTWLQTSTTDASTQDTRQTETVTTATTEESEMDNNLVPVVKRTETTTKTIPKDVANEIEISPDYNVIRGKSRIETVSLLGLIPGLSVVSGIAILIFLITMGSLMYNHHRKIKRIKNAKDQVLKIDTTDLGIHRFYGESTLPVKTIFENPVYSSDLDFEKDTPTMESFKPLPASTNHDKNTIDSSLRSEIFRRSCESAYDHPPSPRSTSNEHLYHEISVIMDYDIPKSTSFRGSISSIS